MKNNHIQKQQDINTGLIVHNNPYVSGSGFAYITGIREFEGLTIIEEIAKSSESYVTYLNGIKVFDKNNELIITKAAKRGSFYDRETARQIILIEIVSMLEKSCKPGSDFDKEMVMQKVDGLLDKAYYKESYIAINNWFNTIK